MNVRATRIPEVLVFEPRAFPDDRGLFYESWERDRYAALGLPAEWRQDNVVHSRRGVLRGLHFQEPHAQHKIISTISGEIFDVAVDLRRGSPTFGAWVGERLSAENRLQLSVPVGFAHGYLVLSETSIVTYKCSERYDASSEHVLRWDDPAIGIEWPIAPECIADRDRAGLLLAAYA